MTLTRHNRLCVGVRDDGWRGFIVFCGVRGCDFVIRTGTREAANHAAHIHEAETLGVPLRCGEACTNEAVDAAEDAIETRTL